MIPDHHYSENGAVEPSYAPDMAAEIDSLIDQIAQMIKEGGPGRVAHWHLCVVESESRSAVANRMKQIVAFLFQPCRNIREKIAGLMFSSELATTINGVRNMTAWAKKNGYSRALVSHYSRAWDKTFGYKISQAFGKSPEACAKYREARIKYLMNQEIRKTAKL